MTADTTVSPALVHGECVPLAAQSICASACQTPAVRDDALDPTVMNDGAIMVVVSLVGDLNWSVFLGVPAGTAVHLAARFAGFDIPFDSADMGDAVGELGNIFAGEVKARLDALGKRVELSLPSVTRGEALHMLFPNESPVEQYTFTTAAGKLLIGVSAKRAIH